MNKENEEKLFKDFPDLYRGKDKPITENLMPFGFECGDGWFQLIYDLSEKLTKLNQGIEAAQVKEKFGGLRFYINSGNDNAYDLINEAEMKSYSVCERCGELGISRWLNWQYTLCNKCYNDLIEEKKWQNT